MLRRLAVLACLLTAVAMLGRAQQLPGAFPPLERYLEPLREQAGIPGMSAAVVQDGTIVWESGFGFQNVGSRLRATPDTPYLVADLSQTLAAILVLQCVEQRHMYLDDPAGRYGVSLPEPNATLRQILSHTSADPPGTAFLYSPERYLQLTSAVEWCAPQPYRKSVAHRILNRLAMKDSVPGTDLKDSSVVPEDLFEQADLDRYHEILDRMAVGYKVDGKGRPERADPAADGISAAGGLVSTVRDLALLDRALDSSVLLTEETLATAWTPTNNPDGDPFPTGLGWFVQYYRGERVVCHFGFLPNAYSALMIKLPARHLTFIALANSDRLSAPFQLSSGDVTRSVFATLFLKRSTCALAGLC
jgi:CubicO group peptidase (beta-lactamase class C family)